MPSSSETQNSTAPGKDSEAACLSYVQVVKFLCEPFLDQPESLRLDCEFSPRLGRVLIRLAVEGEDKGRIFGRGGRNIQAIRIVLQAIAQSQGKTAHLEIFGSPPAHGDRGPDDRGGDRGGDDGHSSHRRRPSSRRDRGGDRSKPRRPRPE